MTVTIKFSSPGYRPTKENACAGDDLSGVALMAHHRFDEAMIAAAQNFVSFYRGNWIFNRIANDRGRVVAAFIMLDLHFSSGGQGFTVAQLRGQARRYTVCSPNRMAALAAQLCVSRLLETVFVPESRIPKFIPAANMMHLQRERMIGTLTANCMINPDLAQAIPAIAADDSMLGKIVQFYLAYWRSGSRATGGNPAVEAVIERDAGLTILFLMLIGAVKGGGYQISDLARHFAISRSHARVIVRTGAEQGLIEQSQPGGPHYGTKCLILVMREIFAAIFQVQAVAVRLALCQNSPAFE